MIVVRQLQCFEHGDLRPVVAGIARLIGCLGGVGRGDAVRLEGLELDGVGARLRRDFDQRYSTVEIAVVVHTGFRNHKRMAGGLGHRPRR